MLELKRTRNETRLAPDTLLPGQQNQRTNKSNQIKSMNKAALITMGVSAFIVFNANQSQAQEAKDTKPAQEESGGHSHFTKIPATVEEIWKEIKKQQVKLTSVVAKKDLGEAHDHAFAIRDLVKALPAKVAAEFKTKAEAGAKEITKIAADIDKSSAAKAQKATEANVKKMDTA
jgi:hypothetical protein